MKVKSLLSGIFILLVLSSFAQNQLSGTEICNAILRISSPVVDGKQKQLTHGFFIDSQIVLSCYAPLKDYQELYIETIDGKQSAAASLMYYSGKKDMALLHVSNPIANPLILGEIPPYENDPVFVCRIDEGNKTVRENGVVTTLKMSQQIGQVLLTDIPVFPDVDGTPLFNEKGEVIGLLSNTLSTQYDWNLAISLPEIVSFLSRPSSKPAPKKPEVIVNLSKPEIEKIKSLTGKYFDTLVNREMRLKAIQDSMIDGWNMFVRLDALTYFIPLLKSTLEIPGSYYYPFDSLTAVKKLYFDDNKFRILNWTLKFDKISGSFDRQFFRYYGVIQTNEEDTSRIIPLFDGKKHYELGMEEDTIVDNEAWYGCQYYDGGTFKTRKKTYYFLLGWEGFDLISDKKIIEILWFDENGMPRFGAPIIKVGNKFKCRLIFQYNQKSLMLLEYRRKDNKIVFDHLSPENPRHEGKKWLYVPDGSYDYLDIKRKYLIYKEQLFGHVKRPNRYAKE